MANRELINKDVADLFEVIFNRIKRDDVELIIEKHNYSWYASMNLSTSSQLEAQKEVRDTIHKAVERINDHDMITIIKVLKESELIKVLDEKN